MIAKQKHGLKIIWGLFALFTVLFIFNFMIKTSISPTSMMWLALSCCVTILSIAMLVKNRLPNKKQILISIILGLLMFVAYQGISFSSVQTCIVTFLCAMASFSIFNQHEHNKITLLKNKSFYSVSASIMIGMICGIVLGVINILLSGESPSLNITLSCFLTALSPAIYEEIAFRAFLYAICLYFLNGTINSKKEKFTCWFMMIIPHVMIHTPESFISGGLISGIMNIIILSPLFGLPFALLQRKRDLTSAMIAHGVVDVIRFCFLGLP